MNPGAAGTSRTGSVASPSTVWLAVVGSASALGTILVLVYLTWIGIPLKTSESPHGILNLQVAGDQKRAEAIVGAWMSADNRPDALPAAMKSLRVDSALLVLYPLAFISWGLLILRFLRFRGRRLAGLVVALVLLSTGAGLCDHLENLELDKLLHSPPASWSVEKEGDAARQATLFAWTKYGLLLALGLAIPIGAAAAIRLNWPLLTLRPRPATRRFRGLCDVEGLDSTDIQVPPSGEPWLRSTQHNRVGLALSGGGIRSATFNLGLLQGLQSFHLLRCFDYLATVSGGGYIGGWWTAWLTRWGHMAPEPLPTGKKGKEVEEVRHLREFSNFLIPRWGFLESEMWGALVAILGGLIPALLTALSLLALALLAWLGLAFLSVRQGSWWVPASVAAGLTLLFMVAGELLWLKRGKAEKDLVASIAYWGFALVAVAAVAGLWVGWSWVLKNTSGLVADGAEWPARCGGQWIKPDETESSERFWHCFGISPRVVGFHLPLRVFDTTILALGAATGLLVFRLLISGIWSPTRPFNFRKSLVSGLDRVVSRLLALAGVWLAAGSLWVAGANLDTIDYASLAAGGGAAGSAGLFAWLRDWLTARGERSTKNGLVAVVKPLVPVVLAYVAVGLTCVFVTGLMVWWFGDVGQNWLIAAGVMTAIQLFMLFVDLTEVGLHAFYRNRIVRAYLGASNLDAAAVAAGNGMPGPVAALNRQTEVRARDDLFLSSIQNRPAHLICCTANDLGGDHLASLSRGARSAVLSRHGLAIGDYFAPQADLRMGSALTASAAAANSNMGSLSMSLGPPVAFLMSALNLRLGLWRRHPASPGRERSLLPGTLFVREMLAWTESGLRPEGVPFSQYVHLSDGGHFENLALYELIRRHCRYILVSDCGADPDVAFDDLGNAVRRIREDFGVEIEIDVDSLKPIAEGISSQHMAVGTIHYDGPLGTDKGILLYFKPSLTGDEPRDVLQYRERNGDFPHETTGDQFYDEAQWESYRRLGEHSVREGLRFLERLGRSRDRIEAADVFIGARDEWYPAPPDLDAKVLDLTERFAALEDELRTNAPDSLAQEIYPELRGSNPSDPPVNLSPDDMRKTVHLLMRMIQFMEDAWIGCYLDTHYNHPLNLGWVNLFQRWAWSPSFRMWWPVLSPMFGSGFRRFAMEQFNLVSKASPLKTPHTPEGRIRCHEDQIPDGLARTWFERLGARAKTSGKRIFTYELVLETVGAAPFPMQVGLAVVEIEGQTAHWTSQDFFVPPSLWGSGIGGAFLRALLSRLAAGYPQVNLCRVAFASRLGERRSDKGSREEVIDLIEFYKGHGFVLRQDEYDKPYLEKSL